MCECGRALRSHSFLGAAAGVPGQQTNLAQAVFAMQQGQAFLGQHVGPFGATAAVASGTVAPSPVAAAPPMAAYYGVHAAEPGRTIDRRNASAERARNAGHGQGSPSTLLLNAPRVRSQASTPQPGPSTSNNLASSSNPAASSKQFCVMFVPHVPPSIRRDAYPSATYRWTAADFARLAEILSKVGLIFSVSLPTAGPVWKEFGDQVIAQCQSQTIGIPGIAMNSPPAFSGPTHLPFLFLMPSTLRRNVLYRTYHPYDELDVNTFTSASLLSKPFTSAPRLPLDDKLSDLPLLIIAPRQDNLISHLARSALSESEPWSVAFEHRTRSTLHKCFAPRVMHVVAAAIDWECQGTDCAIPHRSAESDTADYFNLAPLAPATLPMGPMPGAPLAPQDMRRSPSHVPSQSRTASLFLPDGDDSSDTEFPSAREFILEAQAAERRASLLNRCDNTCSAPHMQPLSQHDALDPRASPSAVVQDAHSSRTPQVDTSVEPRLVDTERATAGTVRDRSSSLQLSHEEEHQAVRRRSDLDLSLSGSSTGTRTASDVPLANREASPAVPPDLLTGPLRELERRDIAAWADRIRRAVPVDVDHPLRPRIVAPDAPTAARTLIFLVRWLFNDPSPEFHGSGKSFSAALAAHVNRHDLTCRLTSLELLVSCGDNLDIQIGEGIGEATSRTLLRMAVKLSLADADLWEQRDHYKSILFHPSRQAIPGRRVRLQACGFLALLHMVLVRAGPDPISPFLLRMMFEDSPASAMSLDAPFLQRLSPETYAALAPWAERDRAVPPDMSPQSPIGQLLYAANINPRGFSSAPSPEELRGIELALMSEMLLGDKDLSQHPDLIAFKDGMHHVLAPGSTLSASLNGESRDFLAFAYDCRLSSIDVLLDHLYFHSTAKNHRQDDDVFSLDADDSSPIKVSDWDAINEDLFETRLRAYLRGRGHPNHPYILELVGPSADTSDQSDPLFRARAFLQLMSGSDLVPLDPDWKLKFYYTHTGDRTADSECDGEPPNPAPLGIHACFYEATVTVDEGLRNLLREEPSSLCDGQALAFDAWVHGALLNANDFTAV
ncbi:hypothetical protein OH77DRAFT_1418840 [Trametes cingulata]|nr:hypothetical protein OH77DRAFT_1418840 [Trametes cingulata]